MFESMLQGPLSRDANKRLSGWRADWRWTQIGEYHRYFDLAYASGTIVAGSGTIRPIRPRAVAEHMLRSVRFPAWETDRLVQAGFWSQVGSIPLSSPWIEPIEWSIDRNRSDPLTRAGSAIKAYLAAGLSDEEIAERVGGQPIHVAVFHDLFFDVRRYIGTPVGRVIQEVLCGGRIPADADDHLRVSRHMVHVGFTCGPEWVDRLYGPRDILSEKEGQLKSEARVALQNHMSWHRTSSNTADQNYRMGDIHLALENEKIMTNRALMLAKESNESKDMSGAFSKFYEQLTDEYLAYGTNSDSDELFASLDEEVPDGFVKPGPVVREPRKVV